MRIIYDFSFEQYHFYLKYGYFSPIIVYKYPSTLSNILQATDVPITTFGHIQNNPSQMSMVSPILWTFFTNNFLYVQTPRKRSGICKKIIVFWMFQHSFYIYVQKHIIPLDILKFESCRLPQCPSFQKETDLEVPMYLSVGFLYLYPFTQFSQWILFSIFL